MSLHTDNVFIAAIRSSSELMTAIGNRLYGTAIPVPEEDVINEPVPYLIVMFDGLNNEGQTKDNPFEGDADVVNISVLATAKTLDALHSLTAMVRNVIKTHLTENDTEVEDYVFSADAIQYDDLKPCYLQVLRYQCDTTV